MTDLPTRGPGRPRTDRGTLGARVTLRLSPAERQSLERAAVNTGTTAAEYARRAALTAAAVEPDLTMRQSDALALER